MALLPALLKRTLEKKPLYLRWRYSPFILRLWLWWRRDTRTELRNQFSLYQSLLPAAGTRLIFDIGAHEGFLTGLFAKAGYQVIAVEPSPRNAAILRARFSNNHSVTVVQKAVSNKATSVSFFESTAGHAFGTLSDKWRKIREESNVDNIYHSLPGVETVTLDKLITQYGRPAFIKIDVEGHEENVIAGLSQKVSLLSFEAILPHFLTETSVAIERLALLSPPARFNYAVDNKMVFDAFAGKEKLIAALQTVTNKTVEVFCRTG